MLRKFFFLDYGIKSLKSPQALSLEHYEGSVSPSPPPPPSPHSLIYSQFCCQLLHNIVKLCGRDSTLVSWVMLQCHYLVFLVTQLPFHYTLNLYIYLHILEADFSNQACIKSLNTQRKQELLELSSNAGHFLYPDLEKSPCGQVVLEGFDDFYSISFPV